MQLVELKSAFMTHYYHYASFHNYFCCLGNTVNVTAKCTDKQIW